MAEDKRKVSVGRTRGGLLDKNVGARSRPAGGDLGVVRGQLLDALLSSQPKATVLMMSSTGHGAEAKRLLERATTIAAAIEEYRIRCALVGLLERHLSGVALRDALAFVSLLAARSEPQGRSDSVGPLLTIAVAAHASDGDLLAQLIDLDLGPNPSRNEQSLRDSLTEHFHDRLIRRCRRFAMSLNTSGATADDLAQQALLKLIEKNGQGKAIDLWRLAWVCVRRRWLENRRREVDFASLDADDLPADSHELRVLWGNVVEVVREVLGELSPRDRSLLNALGDEATHEELRPIMQGAARSAGQQASDEAIKKAITRARQALRQALPRGVRSLFKARSKKGASRKPKREESP